MKMIEIWILLFHSLYTFLFLVSLSHSINHLFERVYIQKNGKQWINQFGRTRKRLCSNCISSVHYFFLLPFSLLFSFSYQSHDPLLNVLSIGKRCCWKYPQCLQRNEQWRGASWGSLRISTLLNSISANSIGKTIILLMILVNWVFSPSYPITSIMPTQTSCRVSIHSSILSKNFLFYIFHRVCWSRSVNHRFPGLEPVQLRMDRWGHETGQRGTRTRRTSKTRTIHCISFIFTTHALK